MLRWKVNSARVKISRSVLSECILGDANVDEDEGSTIAWKIKGPIRFVRFVRSPLKIRSRIEFSTSLSQNERDMSPARATFRSPESSR